MVVSNSIVKYLGSNITTSSILLQNNVIINPTNNLIGTFRNNVIFDVYTYDGFEQYYSGGASLKSECNAYNNLYCYENALNGVIVQSSNYHIDFGNTPFGNYHEGHRYPLLDGWETQYIGTDGTQVGIHGGSSPFNTILTIPTIVSKNIAPKTENGKLKVSITVKVGDNTL
mgnify:FL=1